MPTNLYAFKDKAAEAAFTRKDLDCMVNWMTQFVLEDDHFFGCKFIFKYGMPGKFPTGEGGYTIGGKLGLHTRPEPEPGEHRVSMRYREVPDYNIKFKGLYEVIAPCTNYYHRDYIQLENPQIVIKQHLAALARTIPDYLRYITYKIFIGTERAKENGPLKEWFEEYIEPKDGAQNGYKFYLHKGYGDVNLGKVLNPVDKKQHPFKTKLEQINKDLRADNKKIEVDHKQHPLVKTSWVKNNLTDKGQQVLCLFDTMVEKAHDIKRDGVFESKYKHKNDEQHWKDIFPRVSQDGYIGIMNSNDLRLLKKELNLSNPVTQFVAESMFPGELITSDLLDSGEGFIIQKSLIQCWILPQLSKYGVYNYENEATRDYIYEFGHTVDKVDIFSSIWFKVKSA